MPSPAPIAGCIARARHERWLGLAGLEYERESSRGKSGGEDHRSRAVGAGDRRKGNSELSFVLGLSWRLRGCTSDVDLVGGLDLGWLAPLLPAGDRLAGLLALLGRAGGSGGKSGKAGSGGVGGCGGGGRRRREALPPLREALLRALPAHSAIPPRLLPSDPSDPYVRTATHGWDHPSPGCRRSRPRESRVSSRKRAGFAVLLSQVDRDSVAALCTQVLRDIRESGNGRRRNSGGGGIPTRTRCYVPPPVVGDPILGSAHALWPVCFPASGGGHDDGREEGDGDGDTRWIVKVPLCGTPDTWDAVGAEALRGEAAVLRLLGTMGGRQGEREEEGRFPAPRPVQADTGVHNALHAPYLIMEHIDGVRLDEYWFEGVGGAQGGGGPAYSAEKIHRRRRAVLRSLARHLLRLSRFETEQGGAVVLSRGGNKAGALGVRPEKAAPVRALDVQAMLDCWFESGGDGSGPDACDHDMDTEWGAAMTTERTPIYTVIQPYTEPRDAYLALLDQYPPQTEASRGVHALLRLLIGMLDEPPGPGGGEHRQDGDEHDYEGQDDEDDDDADDDRESRPEPRPRPFVLAHPDLQLRHVIVSEDDGEVRGIVGWDGACAVPRSIGNEALPRWLVRDFNPFTYRWTPEVKVSAGVGGAGVVRTARRARDGDGVAAGGEETDEIGMEDPSWVLAELRRLYVDIVAELKDDIAGRDAGGGGQESTPAYQERKDAAVFSTKQSLLALALDEAVRDPRSRSAILRQVLARCSRRFETLDYGSVVEALGRDQEPDAYMMRCLRRNVRELVDKGFVKGAAVW